MLKKLSLYTLAFLGAIMLLSSCEKEYESIENIDETRLQQYLKNSNLPYEKDSSGFYYRVDTAGVGNKFTDRDTVLYNLTVKSLGGGTEYYNSTVKSANLATLVGYSGVLVIPVVGTNPLQISMPAIRTAILALKPGGTAKVLLPSYLAFGKNGLDDIKVPSNEPIELTIVSYPEKSQAALDNRLIQEFLARNSLTADKDSASGVYYNIAAVGTGTDPINRSSTIKAKYTGRLLNGTVFDSSADGTFKFTLGELEVNGWKVILPKVRKGGKVRMLIPSGQAYGTSATGLILSNSVLDFDVEVDSVGN
jgi:FKBP-type peptidyl-prolyl cis-trans isomerase